MSDTNVRMVLVKLELIREALFTSLDDRDAALTVHQAWEIEVCVLPEQVIYAGPQFGAQKKLLDSLVLIRGEGHGKKEM